MRPEYGNEEHSDFEPGSSPELAHAGCSKYWNPVEQDYTNTSEPAGFFPPEWYGPRLRNLLNGNLDNPPNVQHKMLIKS